MKLEHEASLDSLRGLCALLVCVHHSCFKIHSGWSVSENYYIFVDLFFILSGYVITKVYLNYAINGAGFNKYIIARIARIYPLHLFMLFMFLGVFIAQVITHKYTNYPFEHNSWGLFLQNILLIHSWGLSEHIGWNAPSWSVSVEFFLYIFFYFAARFFKQYFIYLSVLVIIALTSYFVFVTNGIAEFFNVSLLRGLLGFNLGICIYAAKQRLNLQLNKSSGLVQVFLLSSIFYLMSDELSIASELLLVFLFACLILYCASNDKTSHPLILLLNTRFLKFIGDRSYSIYLIHIFVFMFFSKIIINLFGLEESFIPGHNGRLLREVVVGNYNYLIIPLQLVLVTGLSHLSYSYLEMPARQKIKAWGDKVIFQAKVAE